MKRKLILSLLLIFPGFGLLAQEMPSVSRFRDGIQHWRNENPFPKGYQYDRYTEQEYVGIADNLAAWQNEDGGWPKNIDYLGKLDAVETRALFNKGAKKNRLWSTLDNRNTYPQIEYLSRVYRLTGDKRYVESAARGVEYILNLQNESGGWRGWDVDAITFNDDVMVGTMEMLQRISNDEPDFAWVDAKTRERAEKAWRKGLETTLQCQVVIDGKKTIWGQQHDHKTLAPCKARTYEFPSLCAGESTDVVRFLMAQPNPSPEIIDAIRSAIAWYETHGIAGLKLWKDPHAIPADQEDGLTGDRYAVIDPNSTEVWWARFYDLKKQEPFLSRRDGTIVYSLAEVNHERRLGYGWYTQEPTRLLKEWKKREREFLKTKQ